MSRKDLKEYIRLNRRNKLLIVMPSTRREFIQNSLGIVGIGIAAPSLLLEASRAHAQAPKADVSAQWIGDYLYIRVPNWGDGQDATQRWLIGHQGSFVSVGNPRGGNGVIDFVGEKLIDSALPAESPLDEIYNKSTRQLRFGGDESIPINLANGMFLGGGHGFVCRQVTVPAHGLRFADIGRRYTNSASLEYVLADIVDADKIKIIPKPTGSAGLWQYSNGAVGKTITPINGGAPLNITEDASSQLWPVVQNYVVSAKLDDGREINRDQSVQPGAQVILTESYGIGNFLKAYEWLVTNEGQFNSSPNFGDPAIETQLQMTVTRTIGWTGFAEITVTPHFYQQTLLHEMHAAQTQKPHPTSPSTFIAFVPETTPLNNQDFAAGADVTTNKLQNQFVKSVWKDADNPPSCLAILAKENDVAKHGVITAMDKSCGGGIPATHAANIAPNGFSLWLSSADKTYLISAFGITVDAGTIIESHAYSGSINPARFGSADFCYLAPESGGYVLYAYKVTAAAQQRIPVDQRLINKVDQRLINKTVTLRRATGGAALRSSTVSERGVLVDFGEKSGIELVISG